MNLLMLLLGITTTVSGKFCVKKLIGEEWVSEGDCENQSEILSEIIKDLELRATPQPPVLTTKSEMTETTSNNVEANFVVRLVNGYNIFSGQVEVYYNETWGTVSDDDWNIRDAIVVCRMLGFPNATVARSRSNSKRGSRIIWLDNVQCTGNETSIFNCSKNLWGKNDCNHTEEAAVVCTPNVRLIKGQNHSGRVEVFHEGEWGRVCDDNWDINDANVVCRMLGFPSAVLAPHDGRFGEGSGKVWLSNVKCTGKESSILDCAKNSWGAQKCSHDRDASAVCAQIPVRLVNGYKSPRFGRVEIYYYSLWGTVCHNNWDIIDANVVCRMLGFSDAVFAFSSAIFGTGNGKIWLDNVRCTGTETSILNCLKNPWNEHKCSHHKDASVLCAPSSVRLVNGKNSYSGRVEVQYNGTWGTICDDNWDINDAKVVCRMFGLANATSAPRGAVFGQGTGRIHFNNVRCTGSEKSIWDCTQNFASRENCDHDKDASVVCQLIAVRLVNGSNSHSGRVEVSFFGEWGTVCDDHWDINDAKVVCRMLGFAGATSATSEAKFGMGGNIIWLDQVKCSGMEESLLDCAKNSWGNHDCSHEEDAGVICTP